MIELSVRMIRCNDGGVILLVTAPAIRRQVSELSSGMTFLTFSTGMRSLQDKLGRVMIECGRFPSIRIVARSAVMWELSIRVVGRHNGVEICLMAAPTIERHVAKLSIRMALLALDGFMFAG